MELDEYQILKLRIKFAQHYSKATVFEKNRKIFIDTPIKEYKNLPKRPNLYLVIEDRVFYSRTLSDFYKVAPNIVINSLKKYILEGVVVSENSIQSIEIETDDGSYYIGDIMEVVTPLTDSAKHFEKPNENII